MKGERGADKGKEEWEGVIGKGKGERGRVKGEQ